MSTVAQPMGVLPNFVRFRMGDADYERLRIFCVKNRTSIQAVCSQAVDEYLDAQRHREKSDKQNSVVRARAS